MARAERQHRRRPEERRRGAAAGQVAVADEPDARPVAQRRQQLAARLAQPDDADADRAARAHEPGLQVRVVDGLHRGDGRPRPAGEEQRGQLDRAEVEPDEDRRRARANASATTSGVSIVDPRSRSSARERRRPGDLEVVARGVAVGEPDESLEGARVVAPPRGPAACPRPCAASQPATRRRLRRAWAARSGSPGTRGRRRTRPAATSGRSGRRQASHEAAPQGAATESRRPTAGRRSGALAARAAAGSADAGLHQRRPALEVGRLLGAVAGQIGLKLYHCSGAAAIVAASASAMAWVARCSSAGSDEATSIGSGHDDVERVVRLAPDGDRQDARAGLGRERRRARPAAPSRRRTGGPGCRPRDSPSRRAGRASRGGAGRRRSRAGCARR